LPVLGFSVFFTIFSLVLALINFAVLKGMAFALELKLPLPVFILAAALLSLLFISSTLLSRSFGGSFIRIFYMAASYWVGFALMCGFVFLIILLPGMLLPEYKRLFYFAGFCLAFLSALYAGVHALDRKVKETIIPFKTDLSLLQVSDVHFGVVNGPKYMIELVNEINGIKPDAVLFTGDLVDGTTHIEKDTLAPLKDLKVPAYFVSGNHDVFDGLNRVYQAVAEAGVTILDGRVVEIKGVQLGGAGYSFKKEALKETLQSLKWKDGKPKILLYHEPKGMEEIRAAGIDLVLSGHTHGGQIIPFNFLVAIPYSYMKGLYNINGLQLFVSTGCGTWGPKMRIGTDSEINFLKLKKDVRTEKR